MSPTTTSEEDLVSLTIAMHHLQGSVSRMSNDLYLQRGLEGHLSGLVVQSSKEIRELRSQLAQISEERDKLSQRVKRLEEFLGAIPTVQESSNSPQLTAESIVQPTVPQVEAKPTSSNKEAASVPEPVNLIDLFLGRFESPYSCKMVQLHINENTKARVELTDIEELNVLSTKKAFKVTVPINDKEEVLSIWPKNIKTGLYKSQPNAVADNRDKNDKSSNYNKRKFFHDKVQREKGYRPQQEYNQPAYKSGQKWQKPWHGGRNQRSFHRPNYQRKPYQQKRWAPNRNDAYQQQQEPTRRPYDQQEQQYFDPREPNWFPERADNQYYKPHPADRYYQNSYRF